MSTQVDLFTNVEPTSVSPAIAKPFVSRSKISKDKPKGRKLTSYNGEDCIYTPREMAEAIVEKLSPQGIILEPCMGDGGFTDIFDKKGFVYEWCEINKGIDYFKKETTNAEWVITNPPFSKVTKFIQKSIELQVPNIALLVTINTIWMNGKLNFLKENGYRLEEIYLIESPYFRRMGEWRQSGFSLGVIVIKKNKTDNFPIIENLKIGEICW